MAGPPIILKAKVFDALADFRNKAQQNPEYDSLKDWEKAGRKRYGPNKIYWRFECPGCGIVASVADFLLVKTPQQFIGFSCIGNWAKDHGCKYTGAGPNSTNPVTVLMPGGVKARMFHFAER